MRVLVFPGPKVKTILDTNNEKPHVLLSNKAKLRSWSGVIALINRTASEARALQNNTGGRTRTMAQAVHLHNELQLGELRLVECADCTLSAPSLLGKATSCCCSCTSTPKEHREDG